MTATKNTPDLYSSEQTIERRCFFPKQKVAVQALAHALAPVFTCIFTYTFTYFASLCASHHHFEAQSSASMI